MEYINKNKYKCQIKNIKYEYVKLLLKNIIVDDQWILG